MVLIGIVYRNQIFPRVAYRQTFDRLFEQIGEHPVCRLMVDVLALAYERGCEAELATVLASDLEADGIPDMATLQARFAPDPFRLPNVVVRLTPLLAYEALL
jgi:hypothetical protein